jgi:hypothetical protein
MTLSDNGGIVMRKIRMGLLILISIAGLCACSHFNKNTEEMTIDMEEEISKMEEYTVDENTPVSIATNVDENGELTDYVEVSVTDSYAETEKITKESLDLLKNVIGAFIDEDGNLLEGYSFVGVKLNMNSEKNLNVNTTSFKLKGIYNGEYLTADCFYQDGKRISSDIHDGGFAEIQQGTTEITVGFFVDKEMMKSEKFFLEPMVFETENSQNNYIEITLQKES